MTVLQHTSRETPGRAPSVARRSIWVASSARHEAIFSMLRRTCADLADLRILRDDASKAQGPVLDLDGAASLAPAGEIWRFASSDGRPVFRPLSGTAIWHRPPYAAVIRLVREQPGQHAPEIIGEAVVSTRQSYRGFRRQQMKAASLLLRRTLQGEIATPVTPPPDEIRGPDGVPALCIGAGRWLLGLVASALFADHWQIGIADSPIAATLGPEPLRITWMRPPPGARYYADPFPWPGTGMIVCEEFLYRAHRGRLVALRENPPDALMPGPVVLDRATHLSYPFTFEEGGIIYVIPESGEARETVLCRLLPDGVLQQVAVIDRGRRLVDATLFSYGDFYWLAYTDLDLGNNDNLCLAYARDLTGPWTPHLLNPVKIDIRSSRPAGAPFWHAGSLYRPAQDCSHTYGGSVVLNRIEILSPTHFREVAVKRLSPDPSGPLPHGLHTVTSAGHRTLVDGKRRYFRPTHLLFRILRVVSRLARTKAGGGRPHPDRGDVGLVAQASRLPEA